MNQRGENIGTFHEGALKSYAVALGLDETAFNECLDSNRYQSVVTSELAEGQDREVSSTPTIIINGELIRGAVPFEQLQRQIQAELN